MASELIVIRLDKEHLYIARSFSSMESFMKWKADYDAINRIHDPWIKDDQEQDDPETRCAGCGTTYKEFMARSKGEVPIRFIRLLNANGPEPEGAWCSWGCLARWLKP